MSFLGPRGPLSVSLIPVQPSDNEDNDNEDNDNKDNDNEDNTDIRTVYFV